MTDRDGRGRLNRTQRDHQRQEGGLNHPERLAQRIGVVTEGATRREPERDRSKEDPDEHEREEPGAE